MENTQAAVRSPSGSGPVGGVAGTTIQRRTMVVLVISQIIGTVGVGIAPSIGVLLASEVTADETWAGLARTASTLGAAALGFPLGNLAERMGRRIALAGGWWISAGGAALLVAAAQWSLVVPMFVGLLLIGGGQAASLQSRFAATDRAEPQRRARSLALVVWVGTLGQVLGPNLGIPGGAIGSVTGLTVFAGAFLIAAICLAVAGAVVFIWLRPDPLAGIAGGQPRRRVPVSSRFRGLLTQVRGHRRARAAVIAIVAAQMVMVAVMTMTPVHIAHQGGTVTFVGITISLHIAGMYALAPVVGHLADRFGYRPPIAAGTAILLISLGIVAVRPDDATWIVISLILLGVGWSFINVAASALFSDSVAADTRTSAEGGVDALSNLGGAVAAFSAGPILAATSFSVLGLMSAVLLLPLLVLLVSGALAQPAAGRANPGGSDAGNSDAA